MSREDDLIARHFAPLAGPAGLGLRDDAALLTPPADHQIVVTVDGLAAGTHFFADDAPASIARKALRVNISDLAAKGAQPAGCVLTLALPQGAHHPAIDDTWLAEFAWALGEDCARYQCPLIGGDTITTSGPLTLSITAFGYVATGRMVLRSGARAGDLVYVSGSIGDAALGLAVRRDADAGWTQALAQDHRAFLLQRYLEPQPRLVLVQALARHAHGAMDVSDGLIGDFAKLMRASGVDGELELARTPFSDAVRAAIRISPALQTQALTGGDDYEILCTVDARDAQAFEASARDAGVGVTCIGRVLPAGKGDARFIDASGNPVSFDAPSYSHL